MDVVENRIKKARKLINQSDYIVIGAGAGLSDAAGFHYSGKRFDENFEDFKTQYHIKDMYSGTFYPFASEEEKWAFWARVIWCNTYHTEPSALYQKILKMVKDKNYFVITTNVDHQFYINGFDMKRYFETQGNYIYLQCQKGCHRQVYDNKDIIETMVKETQDCKIPSCLIPKCPICGGKMDIHVRKDDYFVETKGWYKHQQAYLDFLKKALKHRVVFLEFGVGFNTPGIIRYPFEKMVYQNPRADLIRFNRDYDFCLPGNEDNVVSFHEDMNWVLSQIETDGIENE